MPTEKGYRYRLLVAVILFAMLPAAGCASPSDEIDVDMSHNGGQVDLNVGQILVVSLESNPTTGYRWEVAEIDDEILRQEDREPAGGGQDHGEQEHRAVRRPQTVYRLRYQGRHTRRHHPRHGTRGDEADREDDRAGHRGPQRR